MEMLNNDIVIAQFGKTGSRVTNEKIDNSNESTCQLK